MKKDRESRVLGVLALIVGAVSLTLGFAAYTDTLRIESGANVNTDDSQVFKIRFSSKNKEISTTDIQSSVIGNARAGFAEISNDGDPTISGLKATFTEPGESVIYNFYVTNTGALKGYLHGITFSNAIGEDSFKKCIPSSNVTESYVTAACEKIKVTVDVQGEKTTSTIANIKGKGIEVGEYIPISVRIDYESGAAVDGDFSIDFGSISLLYSSVDN